MTLPRTIKRREQRKQAKQRQIDAAARWARMSPEMRKFIHKCDALAYRSLLDSLTIAQYFSRDLEFASGDQWARPKYAGGMIDVRLPERYRR